MPADIAVCRHCGGHHVRLCAYRLGGRYIYFWACDECGHETDTRTDARIAADDVIWRKPEEVKR